MSGNIRIEIDLVDDGDRVKVYEGGRRMMFVCFDVAGETVSVISPDDNADRAAIVARRLRHRARMDLFAREREKWIVQNVKSWCGE